MHNEPFMDLCAENNDFGEEQATSWAMWMWVREYALKHYNFWDTTACEANVSLGDGDNAFDWVTTLPPGTIGLATPDTTDVCGFDGHDHLQEERLEFATATWPEDGVFIGGHASTAACVANIQFRETIVGHEMGHAYGIDHTDTIPSIMNSAPVARGCNLGSGLHSQPNADAQRGAVHFHGRNTNNIQNASAMIWWRDAATGNIDNSSYDNQTYCGASFTARINLMSYYADIYEAHFRFVLVRDNQTPTLSPANYIVVQNIGSVPAGWFTLGQYDTAHSLSISPALLSTLWGYRLWVQVDYLNHATESDEGDQFVPLDITIRRGPC